MPTSPAYNEAKASEIRRAYAEAERLLIALVTRRLERGIDSPGWAEKKLAEIRILRREAGGVVEDLKKTNPDVAKAIEEAYGKGSADAIKDLKRLEKEKALETATLTTQAKKLELLIDRTIGLLGQSHMMILRQTEDAYRSIIAEATTQVATGTQTRRQATQVALNRFADRGISGFQSADGRSWDMASYAEMAVRSASGQAAIEGHIGRLTANGYDLVVVSDSPEECGVCRPWEGKILSISGQDRRHKSLNEATSAGLFHPSCTHTITAWVPGLSKPKGEANPEGYEERQQQRYNERQIRHWKRREATAITDQDKAYADAKVRDWQAKQRRLIDDTGRRRKYERESIKVAR